MTRNEILRAYGGDVLTSKYYVRAVKQVHHVRTDVASHSINVAMFSIRFYRILHRLHVKIDLPVLIFAALSHDLGIIGREKKFKNNYECLKGHPKDSIAIIKKDFPKADPKVCKIIACHMFPMCLKIPASREAWILILSDKCATCTDWFCHYSPTQVLEDK